MNTRKGISSIIGMTFGIVALATILTYVNYSITTLDQYNQNVLGKNQQILNQELEKFQITNVGIVSNKLNVTVENTGNLPINFTKIWVQNTTALDLRQDWAENYPVTNAFVVPGGSLKNIGQTLPLSINPTNSYYVKLITSRGNMGQFSINSANSAPLNVQLLFLPATVASGFKSELVMIVTNNSTGTLTNVSPSALPTPTYTGSGTTSCVAGPVSPTSITTLPPGGMAFFKWDVTVSGYGADTCTFTITQPLQNGYSQTLSATATVTVVLLSDSNYAANAGVITSTYANFRWTEVGGSNWNTDWSFPANNNVAFSVLLTNNNQTSGGYKFWMSKNSQLMIWQTTLNVNGKPNLNTFYIVNKTTSNPLGLTTYSPDYNVGIPNQGGTTTVYFGANDAGGFQPSSLTPGTYFGQLVLYGKFTVNSGDNTGGVYAQTIPFLAVVSK